MTGEKPPNHWGMLGTAVVIAVILIGIGLLLA